MESRGEGWESGGGDWMCRGEKGKGEKKNGKKGFGREEAEIKVEKRTPVCSRAVDAHPFFAAPA